MNQNLNLALEIDEVLSKVESTDDVKELTEIREVVDELIEREIYAHYYNDEHEYSEFSDHEYF